MPGEVRENLTVTPLAFDTVGEASIRAIDVQAAGTLVVEDIEGNTAVYVFHNDADPLSTSYPYRLKLRIRRVVGDGAGGVGVAPAGTDIPLANLVGLH